MRMLGSLSCGEGGCPGSHGVAYYHGGSLESLDESDDVACRLDVSLGGERRVACAVASEIRAGDPVNRFTERLGPERSAGVMKR